MMREKNACTVVLDLQGCKHRLQGAFRGGAVYTEDDIKELNQRTSGEFTATSDST